MNSDSLAGESLASGGDFAANGASVASSNQPARSTTTNTTDTSSATVLPAAVDAQSRLESEEWREQGKVNAGGILLGDNKTTGTVNAPEAHVQRSMPKGANLKEGGFDSDDPNASFTAEIGGKNDPGRRALNEAAAKQSDGITSGGIGDSSTRITNDGQFDKLGGDTSA